MTTYAIIEGDPNKASRFLNYASSTLSSRTSPGLLGSVMGPNTFGEVATVVSVERTFPNVHPAIDGELPNPVGTRLGFQYGLVAGSEADQEAKLIADQIRSSEQGRAPRIAARPGGV